MMADKLTANERYTLKPLENDGKRMYKLEIDEFIADNEMTNLFLIALAELQKNSLRFWLDGHDEKKPDWLTYYSLAGIHGYPRDEWNDYPNNFATVHDEMVKQAKGYSKEEKQVYLEAAARFRLPYWDIIMPRNDEQVEPPPGKTRIDPTAIWGCPEILKVEEVFVKLPENHPDKIQGSIWNKIKNPLASFAFPTGQEYKSHPERKKLHLDSGFNQVKTARVPTPNSNNETDRNAVDLVIQRQAVASANLIWHMLNPDQKEKAKGNPNLQIFVNEKRSWSSFANDHYQTDSIEGYSYATVSLESFHDGIHVLLGTGTKVDWDPRSGKILFERQGHLPKELRSNFQGHMGDPRFAAFDPIFWLHHNNIERLLTLHQAMYPDKYVDAKLGDGELYPFMTGKGRECYKSNDALIKDYWRSGFAVPGDKELQSADAIKLIRKYLTDNYYWVIEGKRVSESLPGWPKKDNLAASWALHGHDAISTASTLPIKAIAEEKGVPELVLREVPLESDTPVHDKIIKTSEVLKQVQAVDLSLPKGAMLDPGAAKKPVVQVTWNAHVRVRKYAFNGSFSIHFFIGHVKDEQPERYMTKKNEVGFTGIFASPADSGCASCERNREEDIIVEDVVPLTTILYDYLVASPGSNTLIRDGELKTILNLEPESVGPFLKANLQWRMIDLGTNLLVGQEQQAKLEVKVSSREFWAPTEENLMGVYGPPTLYPEITSTKAGGYGYTY